MLSYLTDSDGPDNRSQAFEAMLAHARKCLTKRLPLETAGASGVEYDRRSSTFRFQSLGQTIIVDYPECGAAFDNTEQSPRWVWHLIMLHYLDMADGVPLGPRPITFRMMQGGFVRGANFDRDSARTIAAAFSRKPVDRIKRACEALGAEIISSNADLCAVFPLFPRFPVTLKVWSADDEMEGSGQMLVNESADHYLTVEDAVVAGEMILDFLTAQYELTFPAQ